MNLEKVKKQNSKKGLKIAVVILTIVAICGIGFGVFELIQNLQKDNQISELKSAQNSESSNFENNDSADVNSSDKANDRKTGAATRAQNPIISATSPTIYSISYDSPIYPVGDDDLYVGLRVRDGEIDDCTLYRRTIKWVGNDMNEQREFYKNCNGISGFSGKIYKIALAGEGQEAMSSSVAFIMEDGTVDYIPLKNLMEELAKSGTASIKGKLKIDGFVTDAFTVGVNNEDMVGGYATTIFVLADGGYVHYSDSML